MNSILQALNIERYRYSEFWLNLYIIYINLQNVLFKFPLGTDWDQKIVKSDLYYFLRDSDWLELFQYTYYFLSNKLIFLISRTKNVKSKLKKLFWKKDSFFD